MGQAVVTFHDLTFLLWLSVRNFHYSFAQKNLTELKKNCH